MDVSLSEKSALNTGLSVSVTTAANVVFCSEVLEPHAPEPHSPRISNLFMWPMNPELTRWPMKFAHSCVMEVASAAIDLDRSTAHVLGDVKETARRTMTNKSLV
jgi:hypothetical protein